MTAQIRNYNRVLVIGPTFPFRGGIAQHTTMMARALSKEVECLVISFSRQYPKFLYPGRNDCDPSMENYAEPNVEYIIDSINPITWRKALDRAFSFRPDIIIIPWWHVYWVPCFGWFVKKLQAAGFEVVFLCHNVLEHERADWKSWLTKKVLKYADRFVVHTVEDCNNLLRYFPNSKILVHPLPVFNFFPPPTEELSRRAQCELLFFGFIRTYKGVKVLLEAMELLREESVFLSIVGEFWEEERRIHEFIEEKKLCNKIEIIARYVTTQEAANFFHRCDIVILPYLSATGSGIIPLAYYYNKPVIATKVGGLPDVVIDGETGIMINPNSKEEIANAVMKSMVTEFNKEEILKITKNLTFEHLVKNILGGNNETHF